MSIVEGQFPSSYFSNNSPDDPSAIISEFKNHIKKTTKKEIQQTNLPVAVAGKLLQAFLETFAWLVVSTPKIGKSIGMMTFPINPIIMGKKKMFQKLG